MAESCTGSSATCPGNLFRPSSTVCRPSAGDCDVAESCTGSSATCPGNLFRPSSTVCRPSAGDCDVAEVCNGRSTACPPDEFAATSVQCRAVAGECDLAESCPGNNAACPPDQKKALGTVCTSDLNECTLDQCDGSSVACQHPANPGAACNDGNACTTNDQCNAQKQCAGTQLPCNSPGPCETAAGATCSNGVCSYPANPGAACNDGDACTSNDRCNAQKQCAGTQLPCNSPGPCETAAGATCSNGVCSYPANTGAACNDGNACTSNDRCTAQRQCVGVPVQCPVPDQCHNPGTCDPQSGQCSNPVKPDGTRCSDGDDCTVDDRCEDGECAPGATCTPTLSPTPTPRAGFNTARRTRVPVTPGPLAAGGSREGPDKLDLIVGGRDRPELVFLRNDGNGNFASQPPVTIANAMGGFAALITLDIDGDGELDVIGTLPDSDLLVVVRGNPDQGLGEIRRHGVGGRPRGVRSGDVTGDGVPDLLVATDAGLVILRGDAQGDFDDPQPLDSDDDVIDFTLADVNGDGSVDLVILRSDQIDIRHADGAGGFPPNLRRLIPGAFDHIAVADVTGDGRPDLAAASGAAPGVVVFRNSDTGLEVQGVASPGPAIAGLTSIDANGDGVSELLALDPSGMVTVLFGTPGGILEEDASVMASSQVAGRVTVADLIGTDLPDFVLAEPSMNELVIAENISDSQPAVTTSTPTRTPTPTPTCAPTGTPYCAVQCPPNGCSVIRPGCLAFPCGPCFQETPCPPGEVRIDCGAPLRCLSCPCATTTPTPNTPAEPTDTPSPPRCVGDCDGSRRVTIEEMVLGVGMMVGDAPMASCPAFNVDGSDRITVDELLLGVDNALNGCQ